MGCENKSNSKMSELPKVSIITACLNENNTIEQTIQSVLKQSYKGSIEYIIVDGGSVDGTIDIIKQYQDKLTLIEEKDDGIYDAINKGIKQVSGDIIGIIHANDWYESDAVQRVVDRFLIKQCDIIVGKLHIYEQNHKTGEYLMSENLCELLNRDIIPHPSTFVKSSTYDIIGLYDVKYNIVSDYKFFLESYLKGMSFDFIPDYLANFRSGGKSSFQLERAIENIKMFSEVALKYNISDYNVLIDNRFKKYQGVLARALLEKYNGAAVEIWNIFIQGRYSIWGIGKWGKAICQFAERNGTLPEFIVDGKCGLESSQERTIERPEILRNYCGTVLVAVSQMDTNLRDMVKELNIQKCIYLEQLLFEWAKQYYKLKQ